MLVTLARPYATLADARHPPLEKRDVIRYFFLVPEKNRCIPEEGAEGI